MKRRVLIAVLVESALLSTTVCARAQSGSLVLAGSTGAVSSGAAQTFMKLAGGTDSNIVVIIGSVRPRGEQGQAIASLNGNASSFDDCSSREGKAVISPACAAALQHMKPFHLKRFALLEADDPAIESSQAVLGSLRGASGVWLTGDNPVEFVHTFQDTSVRRELTALLARGGVIGADSGAAIAQGSLIVCDHNVKGPDGEVHGLAFLPGAAIDPEANNGMPSSSLSGAIATHPGTIGISLGEGGAIVVQDGSLRVVGTEAVLVSDGENHYGRTYYRIPPEEQFDLETHAAKYVPQTEHEKFDLTLGLLFRPRTVLQLGAAAGIAQWANAPREWGQGSEAYAHRFGVVYGLLATRQSLLFGTAMLDHEDLRRLRSEKSGFWPRTGDAIKFAFESRRDNGSVGFAYARFVSDFGTGILARQLYPSQSGAGAASNSQSPTRPSLVQFGLATVAADTVGNVFFEFSPDLKTKLRFERIKRALHLP